MPTLTLTLILVEFHQVLSAQHGSNCGESRSTGPIGVNGQTGPVGPVEPAPPEIPPRLRSQSPPGIRNPVLI
jgi:hypothetical protein